MTTNMDQLYEVIKPQTEIQIIPALPGFNLLSPIIAGDNHRIVNVVRQPIIAWRAETSVREGAETKNIRHCSLCYPITPDRSVDSDSPANWAIEHPDGRCTVPFDCICESSADVLWYWQEAQAKSSEGPMTSLYLRGVTGCSRNRYKPLEAKAGGSQ